MGRRFAAIAGGLLLGLVAGVGYLVHDAKRRYVRGARYE